MVLERDKKVRKKYETYFVVKGKLDNVRSQLALSFGYTYTLV